LTWIYNISAGSILMATVFHAAANVAGRLLLEPVLGADGFLTLWWLMAAGYALAAVVVIARTRGHLGTDTSHPLASTATPVPDRVVGTRPVDAPLQNHPVLGRI
jgi:hypothetical protein